MSSDASRASNDNQVDLTRTLQRDLLACDFKYSLFNAAAHSITHDSCLKPFPPMFTSDGQSNIDQLIQALAKVPPLRVLFDQIRTPKDQNVIDFLQWLLVNEDIRLSTVDRNQFDRILEKPGPYNRVQNGLPTFIFEVTRKPNAAAEQKFQQYSEDFGTEFAFHGSKTSNFYSILNHGLNQHLNKQSLYGEGTYLSKEIQISLYFSPASTTWKSSLIGESFSCVALCEYIVHPQFAKSHVKTSRSQLPEKYILVTNNEVVAVRYLLVYANRPRSLNGREQYQNRLIQWLWRNKLLAFVLVYLAILALISLNNSDIMYHAKKYWLKR